MDFVLGGELRGHGADQKESDVGREEVYDAD